MIDYNDLTKNIKDGLKFPTGATSERGNPSKGSLRFNSETGKPEIYAKSRGWKSVAQESSGSYSYLTTDLLVDLDAANPNSYSGSGSTWTDLQGNLNMQKEMLSHLMVVGVFSQALRQLEMGMLMQTQKF